MKKLVLIAMTALLSNIAFANGGDQYICKAKAENDYDLKTVVITQMGQQKIEEGTVYPFKLEVFEAGQRKPTLSKKVFVETEDVMFGFENKSEKISGMIYMDELDQSWIHFGDVEYRMNCN